MPAHLSCHVAHRLSLDRFRFSTFIYGIKPETDGSVDRRCAPDCTDVGSQFWLAVRPPVRGVRTSIGTVLYYMWMWPMDGSGSRMTCRSHHICEGVEPHCRCPFCHKSSETTVLTILLWPRRLRIYDAQSNGLLNLRWMHQWTDLMCHAKFGQ